jgi:hypothetical protein
VFTTRSADGSTQFARALAAIIIVDPGAAPQTALPVPDIGDIAPGTVTAA